MPTWDGVFGNPQTDEAIYIKDSLQLIAEEQQFFQALQEANNLKILMLV